MTTPNQWDEAFEILADQAKQGLDDFVRVLGELELALRRLAPSYTQRYLDAVPRMVERSRRRHVLGRN
jgi:hypothetical protein